MEKIEINANDKKFKIDPNIFGHFSEHLGRCIYEGIYVGENSKIPNKNGIRTDVASALRELEVPVLRWPGGCFADEYHWKDGIGEKSQRKKIVNTNWGGVSEDNSFGTHEFMALCSQLGCEPYITGNLGSGGVREMSEWIEYITCPGGSPMSELRKKNGREKPWKLKYFGIGNENWGGGGNMRPEYYADLYRQYQTFCRDYGDNKLYKIACGPNADDYNWTDKLLESVKPWHASAISLHYYTIPTGNWDKKGDAVDYTEAEYYSTLKNAVHIDEIIKRHLEIMSKRDPEHKIKLVVDEWGNWYDAEKGTNPAFLFQQNTMRDAVTASYSLNIFMSHGDRISMTNIAQMVNVLQSVLLTEGEKMVRTPTYFVFYLYRPHMNGNFLKSGFCGDKDGAPILSYSATEKDGKIDITITNGDYKNSQAIEFDISGFSAKNISGEILSADDPHEHNDFKNGETATLKKFADFAYKNGTLRSELPPASVTTIKMDN